MLAACCAAVPGQLLVLLPLLQRFLPLYECCICIKCGPMVRG